MKAKKKVLSIVMAATCISSLATFNISAELTDNFPENFISSNVVDDVLLTDSEMIEANTEDTVDTFNNNVDLYDTRAVTATLPTSASTAKAISGNTPYFVGTYNLNAGSAGYVKLTATQNYNCSVYTTGSTNTYLEVYRDAACTDRVTANDNSGHGNNARVYFYITSGSTYYIKVRGASSSVSGAYSFVLHRGMPTSRSEKGDMISTYNSDTYMTRNNCYTYALGYYYNPVTGEKFRGNGQNPGEMSGNPIYLSDLKDVATAKAAIESALTRDCNYFGGDWAEISSSAQPRQGYYKVALVLAPGSDYHWYRQIPNGKWGHKPASYASRLSDFSNKIIYYPNNCDRNGTTQTPPFPNYTEFVGWYEIKTPTGVAPVSTYSEIGNEKTYATNFNLTMTDINALYSGMSYDAAMDVLGEPHDYYGSGMIGSVYNLSDGNKIVVYYRQGVIDVVKSYSANGTYTNIVE